MMNLREAKTTPFSLTELTKIKPHHRPNDNVQEDLKIHQEHTMSYQDYLPTNWIRHRKDNDHPLVALRKEVDSLFDDFGNGFFSGATEMNVRSNVSETETEFCITAELPGMTEADVDVSIAGDCIIIKGEKKSEKDEESDDKGRQFQRIERTSGACQRMMTLPFVIDADTVEAVVKDGVLTVTIPKPPETVAGSKKIKVAHGK